MGGKGNGVGTGGKSNRERREREETSECSLGSKFATTPLIVCLCISE